MGIGADILRAMEEGATEGLIEAAKEVLDASEGHMPVGDPEEDPAPEIALAESDRIVVDPGGKSVQAVVATEYAAKQHEDQRLDHPRGGAAQYAEKGLMETLPRIDNIVASKVRANMRPQARLSKSRRT